MDPAQDEGELFDLVDEHGRALGRSKPRRLVHRDGDWHRSLHIWVWGLCEEQRCLVFQRRSAGKDTHPLALDVAVTGHLRAGESIGDALREAEEEIGLSLGLDDVVTLGTRRRRDRTKPGIVDNEVQEIVMARAPVDIAALSPSPSELAALVALPLACASDVLLDGGEALGVRLTRDGENARFVEETIRARDFVPIEDGYYAKAFESVVTVIAGGRPDAWILG